MFGVWNDGRRQWKFAEDFPRGVVAAYKETKPRIWTRHVCNFYSLSAFTLTGCTESWPLDLEGWQCCSICTYTVCDDCNRTTRNVWAGCENDDCGAILCPEHSVRITTPNDSRHLWLCCVPWAERADPGPGLWRCGWDLPMPQGDFNIWSAHGWFDDDHPNGLHLEPISTSDARSSGQRSFGPINSI